MKQITVTDLMVPLEEYATVSEEATLYEVIMALEKAHEELDRSRFHYLHRAVLVLDKNNTVVGKVSQLDSLRALEPKYGEMWNSGTISRAGFSPQFLKSMMERFSIFGDTLKDICATAIKLQVKDFMYTPGEGEYIKENAKLGEAIHQLVMGHHQSLLVTSGDNIVGVLRLTDVFMYIFQEMRACETKT
ncbi:MAG: CBS domain-containing protein [Deltaproteobacteria bacterium]|nr:CBS domain-containing protein [Deltaproteobacteria bacterium]